jgi:isoquinoline 1-oxidoreductase alpha subunit
MPTYTLTINNIRKTISVDPDTPLLWVLRDNLGLTGTKYGCGMGMCGTCTIVYKGEAVRACTLTVAAATEGTITTIEGISEKNDHPLQQAWKELDVPQCGYCQSGLLMTAVALLDENPKPSNAEIDDAFMGNICRCGTYSRVRKAIHLAAIKLVE